jgi:pimeloyl-ACP methyl ester carboxylesterase
VPTTTTNGVATHYERAGDPAGPPVVFLHGLGLDHRLWRPQFAALEEYDLVACDYRGHGKTGPTDRADYSVGLLAEDLRALVAALGLEDPVLVAHSYGGLIAAEYGVCYPEDLAGIVFADARTAIGEGTVERLLFGLQPAFDVLERLVGPDRVQRAMAVVAERLFDFEAGPDEHVPELGTTPGEYADAAGSALSRPERRKLSRAGRAYVGADPADFAVPVLYVYGELTGPPIAGKADRLRRAPTDVRVREVEGASHTPMLERPEAFDAALRSFLGEVTAGDD